jgi:hypothetical protein
VVCFLILIQREISEKTIGAPLKLIATKRPLTQRKSIKSSQSHNVRILRKITAAGQTSFVNCPDMQSPRIFHRYCAVTSTPWF